MKLPTTRRERMRRSRFVFLSFHGTWPSSHSRTTLAIHPCTAILTITLILGKVTTFAYRFTRKPRKATLLGYDVARDAGCHGRIVANSKEEDNPDRGQAGDGSHRNAAQDHALRRRRGVGVEQTLHILVLAHGELRSLGDLRKFRVAPTGLADDP